MAEAQTQTANSNPTSSTTLCPTCKGNGWILYKPDSRLFYDIYGDTDIEPNEYAKPCPDCRGNKTRYIDANEKDLTGVPEAFRFVDISKFKYNVYSTDTTTLKRIVNSFVRDYEKWEAEGRGLYIWSAMPGSGKTFLASCLGKSVMVAKDRMFRFITVPDYLAIVGESIRRERGEEDQSLIYRTCELLVFDDIGAQISKEWQLQELFRLVDMRMKAQKVTIFTSNLPLNKLNVDERIKSRIAAMSVTIQMPEESVRNRQAADAQKDFLDRVLERKRNET